jgi:hypothetical protein
MNGLRHEIGAEGIKELVRSHRALSATTREQAARIAELEERLAGFMKALVRVTRVVSEKTELEAKLRDIEQEKNRLAHEHTYDQQITIPDLWAKLEQAEQERDTWKKSFHSVTPGGSEYTNDPQACVDFVRKSRSDQHEAILKFKQERDQFHLDRQDMIGERDELLKEKCQLQQDHAEEVTNLQRHIQALQKLDTERAVECTALRERVGRAENNFLTIQVIAMKLYDLCKGHDLIKHDVEWLKIIVPTGEITEADIRWAEQALKEA